MTRWLWVPAILGALPFGELGAHQDDIETLVDRLTNPDIEVREEATATLIRQGVEIRNRIRKLLKSDDAELRGRARLILDALPLEFELLREVKAQDGFALSPNGKQVVFSADGKTLEIMNLEAGEVGLKIEKARGWKDLRVGYIAWEAQILCVQIRGDLCRVDPESGIVGDVIAEDRTRHTDFAGTIESMTFLTTGDALISSQEGLFILLAKGGVAHNLPQARRGIIRADGSLIVGLDGRAEPTLTLYPNYKSWKNGKTLSLSREADWIVGPPDLARVTIGSRNAEDVEQINLSTLKQTARKELKDGRLTTLSIRRDGRWLLVGTDSGSVHIIDEARLAPLCKISVGTVPHRIIATEDGSVIGVATSDGLKLYKRRE